APIIIFLPLALKIGTKFAFARPCGVAADGPFVPIEPQPSQPLQNYVYCLLYVARHIRVLDAEDKRAIGVPGVKPIEEGRASPADVQEASGTGSEPNANFHSNSLAHYSENKKPSPDFGSRARTKWGVGVRHALFPGPALGAHWLPASRRYSP